MCQIGCLNQLQLRNIRAELRLFIEDPYTVIYFRLPDNIVIHQAEVRAITEGLNWHKANTRPAAINVLTNRKVAIKSITSKTVLEYINPINNYSLHGSNRIIWVPGHTGIRSIETANSLSKTGGELATVKVDIPKPLNASHLELKTWAKNSHITLWNN